MLFKTPTHMMLFFRRDAITIRARQFDYYCCDYCTVMHERFRGCWRVNAPLAAAAQSIIQNIWMDGFFDAGALGK
jgi:hypothetical protein